MLERVLEPEVMDSLSEAEAYDAMDHSHVNVVFADDLLAVGPEGEHWLDLGTGPAHIPIEIAGRRPEVTITAVDLARAMLDLAERNVAAAGVASRIRLVFADAKNPSLPAANFACVFSNSLVHHLSDPSPFWRSCRRLAAPGGLVFVRDLVRPQSQAQLQSLVDRYAADCDDEQRRLFAESLHAALTVEEVRLGAEQAGLLDCQVALSSDRHWTLIWRAPSA